MRNNFTDNLLLRFTFLVVILMMINNNSEAKKIPGFIITNDFDTIVGDVRMYLFNRVSGNINITGIDLETYFYEVSFKELDTKQYKTYKPQDIIGFSFTYNTTKYMFHRFIIERKSIVKKERKTYRFLNLLFKNEISLYSDLNRVYHGNNIKDTHDLSKPPSFMYKDYYLYNNTVGLSKINRNTYKELLKLYGQGKRVYSSFLNIDN